MGIAKLVSRLLSFTLIFGWALGCLRYNLSSTHVTSQGNLPQQHPVLKITILAWMIILILFDPLTNIIQEILIAAVGTRPTGTLSDYIIYTIPPLMWVFVNSLRRICFLWYSHDLFKIFSTMRQLDTIAETTDAASTTGGGGGGTPSQMKTRYHQHQQQLWNRFPNLSIFTFLGTTLLIGFASFMASNILSYEYRTDVKLFADYPFLIIIVDFIATICADASSLLSFGLVILLGLLLLEHYNRIVLEFLCKDNDKKESNQGNVFILVKSRKMDIDKLGNLGVTVGEGIGTGECVETNEHSYHKQFQSIQKCFSLYNNAVGFLILINLCESSLLFVINFYQLISNSDGKSSMWSFIRLIGTVQQLVAFYLTAYIGQLIKETMQRVKAIIRATALSKEVAVADPDKAELLEQVHNRDTQSRSAMVDYILHWDWQLTAVEMFNVDYRIFPMITGTMMTFVMFIFQLKMTEDTVSLRQVV